MDKIYCNKGQSIYQEGSTPLGAYFVKKGKLKISISSACGKTAILRIALKDEVVNYTDIFSHTDYSSSATAIEDSELLFIPKKKFLVMVKEQSELCDEILKKLATDKKFMESRIVELAYKPVRGRLADALLTLDLQFNKDNDRHEIQISRSDLSCFIGTSRESVNRLLSEFRKSRLISTGNHQEIKILDTAKLSEVSKMYD